MLKTTSEMRDIPEIMELSEMDAVFYLTGSRYFGTARTRSDWDFFTNDPGVGERLLDAGWQTVAADTHYLDTAYGKGRVHVQVVQDAARKRRVQMYLYRVLRLGRLPKEQAKALWSVVDNLIEVIEWKEKYGQTQRTE